MADQDGEKKVTEVTEKTPEKIPEKIMENINDTAVSDGVKTYRMFGREKPLHHVFGGGKSADVLLWRDKKISGGVLGVATLIWFINKSPLQFPETVVPEDIMLGVASSLRVETNRALAILRDIASGKELKKFLAVIAGLWFASVVGGCCNFLTLLYISFVLLHTVPVLYEKFENQVDPLAEKALVEFKKQYAVFDAKVLSQIPRGPLKDKKMV